MLLTSKSPNFTGDAGHHLLSLDGKVAVVTGGSRGIGTMIARGLLDAGAALYISSRKEADLDATVAELFPHGPISAIPADVGTADGVAHLAAALTEREGAVHNLFSKPGSLLRIYLPQSTQLQ